MYVAEPVLGAWGVPGTLAAGKKETCRQINSKCYQENTIRVMGEGVTRVWPGLTSQGGFSEEGTFALRTE